MLAASPVLLAAAAASLVRRPRATLRVGVGRALAALGRLLEAPPTEVVRQVGTRWGQRTGTYSLGTCPLSRPYRDRDRQVTGQVENLWDRFGSRRVRASARACLARVCPIPRPRAPRRRPRKLMLAESRGTRRKLMPEDARGHRRGERLFVRTRVRAGRPPAGSARAVATPSTGRRRRNERGRPAKAPSSRRRPFHGRRNPLCAPLVRARVLRREAATL
jgi:hypothetical protein